LFSLGRGQSGCPLEKAQHAMAPKDRYIVLLELEKANGHDIETSKRIITG
jgi:hypothetical protein